MKSEILNNLLIILTDFTIKVIHSNGTTPRSKYEKKARIDVFYTTIFPWNERGFICNRFFMVSMKMWFFSLDGIYELHL